MSRGVAVVLAGGGARGAYEAGVCSVVLPALEARGEHPDIYVGTSAGAINAVALASLAHLGAASATDEVLTLWRGIRTRDVFRSPPSAVLASVAGWALRGGRGHRHSGGLLDTTPLGATLARLVDWKRVNNNAQMGQVKAVGVVATACSTGRSVVFVGRPPGVALPGPDAGRGIEYRRATLHVGHVLASAAIPVAFPAVELKQPAGTRDWYLDGGVRLNTPIKPALALGADRVVVVATAAATSPAPTAVSRPPPPGMSAGATHLLRAMLVDRMVEDLNTLIRKNEAGAQQIHWLFGGPPAPTETDPLGRLVTEVLGGRGTCRPPLHRLLAGMIARDPSRAEIISYLFFDPEFIDGAIKLGQHDARTCLANGVPVWQPTTSRLSPIPN
jgi:NTE family protein